MANWKTAKHAQELGQILGVSNEALYELAMLNLRINFERIENDAKLKAESKGAEYKEGKVYWDVIETQIKQLYNVA
jgi:hypothetical protein